MSTLWLPHPRPRVTPTGPSSPAPLRAATTILLQPLFAQDTRLTLDALRMLGVPITVNPDEIIITGCNGRFPTEKTTVLDLDNSGTSLRLITSLALLCRHPLILTGSQRMQERPIGPLAQALLCLGGTVEFLKNEGYPPLKVSGHLEGGSVVVDGTISSQFISSLLLVAPYAETAVEVVIPSPPASQSYLDITLDVMQVFGANVTRDGYARFRVDNLRQIRGKDLYDRRGLFVGLVFFCHCCGLRWQGDGKKPRA